MFAAKPRVNLVLDTLILVLFVVALGSGLLLEYVYAQGGREGYRGGRGTQVTQEPTGVDSVLGLSRAEMDTLHLYTSLAVAAGVGIHLLFHVNWITCQLRRLIRLSTAPQPRAE